MYLEKTKCLAIIWNEVFNGLTTVHTHINNLIQLGNINSGTAGFSKDKENIIPYGLDPK